MNAILTGEYPGIPNIKIPIVDVRDVAKAHLAALFKDGLHS